MDLPFPHNDSAKSTICGLTDYFENHHVIPHSTAYDPGTHFLADEVQQ